MNRIAFCVLCFLLTCVTANAQEGNPFKPIDAGGSFHLTSEEKSTLVAKHGGNERNKACSTGRAAVACSTATGRRSVGFERSVYQSICYAKPRCWYRDGAALLYWGETNASVRFYTRKKWPKAKDFLITELQPSGFNKTPPTHQRSYSHALATIALCELFAISEDDDLRKPAQQAVDAIVNAQSKEGGWRYRAKYDSDTSVTVWMTRALCTARCAGLLVQQKAFDAIPKYLDTVSSNNNVAYTYQVNGPSKAQA